MRLELRTNERLACYLAAGIISALASRPMVGENAGDNAQTASGALWLETRFVRFELDSRGQNFRLIDKSTGANYIAERAKPFAFIRVAGNRHYVSSVVRRGDLFDLRFEDSDVRATIKAVVHDSYVVLEVVSVEGANVDEFTFVNLRLNLTLAPEEPMVAYALALNVQTDVPEIPRPTKELSASCYGTVGFVGAKVALVCCPKGECRDVLKEVVSHAADIPKTRIGGPWALDAENNRGSYLIDANGQITEQNVDEWIQLAKNLGFTQIDFHCGQSFRFGDYAPNPATYPDGLASVKRVVDKLHQAGILAGLHTYAFFLAKDTPWVTPTPDSRLGSDAVFTLARDVSADATVIEVTEPTSNISPIVGFQIRNSATLRIDDELVVFHDVGKSEPYTFSKCERGACGTKSASHAKGAKAFHLTECFGLFAPDPASSLLTEIAARIAEVYNTCGFDMIYLDAVDGLAVLGENDWHYVSKFSFELARRLNRPAIFDMSHMNHHLWYIRSRFGAWDVPARGLQQSVDLHCIANEESRDLFLPTQLGWWGATDWNPLQPERTFPEDIEYLCSRCIASDSGLSLLVGFTPQEYAKSARIRRLSAIIKRYEDLRRRNYFGEEVKQKLRVRGDEFSLEEPSEGRWQFRPIQYDAHKVTSTDERSLSWIANNRFGAQPARLRIEALVSATRYDAPTNLVLANFATSEEFSESRSNDDVVAKLENTRGNRTTGEPVGCFSAESHRREAESSWTMVGKKFPTNLNLNEKGLGVWVHGDGKGEVLNFQLGSPVHISPGLSDRYLDVNFTGWRYFELIETEGERILNFQWPYCSQKAKWLTRNRYNAAMQDYYTVFAPWVEYASIEYLKLWFNDLPPGERVTCYLSPIKALPLVRSKIVRPTVTIGDQTISFPVEVESGGYLELTSPMECRVYNSDGEVVAEAKPEGNVPLLRPGPNRITFSCQDMPGLSARAVVTVISTGDAL